MVTHNSNGLVATITAFLLVGICCGFVPHHKNAPATSLSRIPITSSSITTTALKVVVDPAILLEAKGARAAFFLCFFGAGGSAATGRVTIPKLIDQWKGYQALKGQGTSLGGEKVDFFGYPEPIYSRDIQKVLSNKMKPTQMASKYPPTTQTRDLFLNFESMLEANPGVASMSVRAVFDSMAFGINKNSIYIPDAEEKLEFYRNDLELMKKDNIAGKAIGVGALVLLLTLLGLADFFAFYHLFKGWFPGWTGFVEFPQSLFDERGLLALPNFFMADLPI